MDQEAKIDFTDYLLMMVFAKARMVTKAEMNAISEPREGAVVRVIDADLRIHIYTPDGWMST